MIPSAPENKAVKGPQAVAIVPPRAAPTAAEIAKAKAELEAEPPPPGPPRGPRQIGHGTCPRCGAEGPIFVDGAGADRKISYGGCVCKMKMAR